MMKQFLIVSSGKEKNMLNKRDIKYIIKKVIIILVVALIFYFIRNIPVKADSINYYISISNSGYFYQTTSPLSDYSDSGYSFSYENNNYLIYFQNNSSFLDSFPQYLITKNGNDIYLNFWYIPKNYVPLPDDYIGLGVDGNNAPMFPPNFYLNYNNSNTNGNWCLLNQDCINGFGIYSSNSNLFNSYLLNTNIDNGNMDYVRYTTSSYYDFWYNNYSSPENLNVFSNSVLPIYYGNDNSGVLIYEPSDSSLIPQGYVKIDLTNYQAVLITPKNYQTMISESSTTTETAPGVFNTYLDFHFYSQYCTRPTLINIANTKDMILNYNNISLSGVSSIVGTCPQDPTEYSLSYQYDMYNGYPPYALLIYNNQIQDSDNWDTASTYMTSYVWYDINLYNYELISDVSSLGVNLSYKDFSGEDKSLIVEKLPTLNESFQYALDTYETSQTEESSFKQRINNFLDFIKSPFNFIYSLTQNSCTPLKAPFPHSNLDITLPCMSTIYENHLPQELLNILKLIINGLLFYRITLANIQIIRKILDPTNDKLEVLEL